MTGAAKLQHQAAVEIEPESLALIHPSGSPWPPRAIQDKVLMPLLDRFERCENQNVIRWMRDKIL